MDARSLTLATTLLLLGAAPVVPQRPGAARVPGAARMMAAENPVSYLLEKGEELQLTEEQRTAMKVLADSLEVLNEPGRETMAAARSSGDRSAMRGLRPVMMALRERNDRFVERVRTLLTEEQKPVADALLEEIMPRRRRGGGPRAGAGGAIR